MTPIHTKILHRSDMTLHVAKNNMSYAKEKQKKNIRAQKHGKEKKKDSPYLKIRDRVMQKGVRVPSRKIQHTCTS